MWQTVLLYSSLVVLFLSSVESLKCYRCHSSQAGCGKEVSVRLQRTHTCRELGYGAGENFCVKVIENKDGEDFITRECLDTLRKHTEHREKMPTVQRHGYCSNARNDDPNNRLDKNLKYCFCNDWNGCNAATGLQTTLTFTLVLSGCMAFVKNILL